MFSELISSYFAGFKLIIEAFEILHGPKEACVNTLKKGCLLGISPGGVREALFSDETYVIIWGNRKGFAQVAIDAKVVSMTCRKKVLKKKSSLTGSFFQGKLFWLSSIWCSIAECHEYSLLAF